MVQLRQTPVKAKEAVLKEDLFALQRAIRWGEGDKLFELFNRTRESSH